MCGICGMFDMSNEKRTNMEVLKRMTSTLNHRGPDAEGFYVNGNVSLGFARLSIIDLEGGMQPIFNEDDSLVLLCNGEIYNYIEIKNELMEKGHRFKTNCDVEVIVHMYEEYGADFVDKLNGQFGFIVYDFKRNRMLCARDHVGIAPFFYTVVDNMFIFGSEIKAILEHPLVKREVDLIGLDQVLTFPGMVSPRTLVKNISSLENGHYLLVQDKNIRNIEYWDLIYPQTGELSYDKDENYYIEKLDEAITKAVKYRLQADVPVGFYISGGLDSSLIASKIHQLDSTPNRHSFSIDFTEKNISESKYQRMVAQHVQSNHHETLFHFSDIANRLQDAVYYSECALKETYNTASMALSQRVREENIKVVLTGEGADELFGGYVGYKFDKLRQNQVKDQNSEEELLNKQIHRRVWGDEDFVYEKNHVQNNILKKQLYSQDVGEKFDQIDCTNYSIINKDR
ncbi:MAG: Asparagine synthetase (glutamine-hydrolyzing) 3 [Firmicutes bacterium ADurb.Bin419]|nr:MAG: Asparagine synthetase (glutamine-hydrolyzing) 3 [Firmicutes bacterium ADurb.Bin419]